MEELKDFCDKLSTALFSYTPKSANVQSFYYRLNVFIIIRGSSKNDIADDKVVKVIVASSICMLN